MAQDYGAPYTSPPAEPKKSNTTMIIIIVVVVVLILCCCSILGFGALSSLLAEFNF